MEIHINFEDDKGKMVPIRGSPYTSSFTARAKASDNQMTGGAMDKQIKKEQGRLQGHMVDMKKERSEERGDGGEGCGAGG